MNLENRTRQLLHSQSRKLSIQKDRLRERAQEYIYCSASACIC
jgi:hypothetical protein